MVEASPKGFSFAELAVVLVVIGIIMGSALSVYNAGDDRSKRHQTQLKLDAIEKAIAGFVALRGRLPCPSNQQISLTSSDAGREYCPGTSTKDVSGSLPAGFTSSYADNTIIIGGIPTKTLNLPDSFMVDGWGNKMDYAVTGAMAANGGTYDAPVTSYSIRRTNKGFITVENAALTTLTSEAVYVLVSHGANGFGAWNKGGSGQNAASSDASEQQNYYAAGVVAGSVQYVSREALPSTSLPYDDLVRFKVKYQVVREAGHVISETVCDIADTVLSTPDTQVANTYVSAYCGATPGDVNCTHYMTLLATQLKQWCL